MRLSESESKSDAPLVVTVEIPANMALHFGADPKSIARTIIEQAAVEAYRSRQISRGQVAQLLKLDWAETEEFLATRKCDRHYDVEDLEEDRKNLDQVLGPS